VVGSSQVGGDTSAAVARRDKPLLIDGDEQRSTERGTPGSLLKLRRSDEGTRFPVIELRSIR